MRYLFLTTILFFVSCGIFDDPKRSNPLDPGNPEAKFMKISVVKITDGSATQSTDSLSFTLTIQRGAEVITGYKFLITDSSTSPSDAEWIGVMNNALTGAGAVLTLPKDQFPSVPDNYLYIYPTSTIDTVGLYGAIATSVIIETVPGEELAYFYFSPKFINCAQAISDTVSVTLTGAGLENIFTWSIRYTFPVQSVGFVTDVGSGQMVDYYSPYNVAYFSVHQDSFTTEIIAGSENIEQASTVRAAGLNVNCALIKNDTVTVALDSVFTSVINNDTSLTEAPYRAEELIIIKGVQ